MEEGWPMSKLLESKFHLEHEITVPPGALPELITFFGTEAPMDSSRITTPPEAALVRALFDDAKFRSELLKNLDLGESTRYELEQRRQPVLPPGWKSKPGDVDVVLVPDDPRLAIGIEVKRHKVTLMTDGELTGADLEGLLEKGIEQTHGLIKVGFHRVVLMLVIPTDGAKSLSGNTLDRGPSDVVFKAILDEIERRKLSPDVGVLLVTMEQPTGRTFETLRKVSLCLARESMPRGQAHDLSERLANAVANGWGINSGSPGARS
jgi:hypothetical protein